MSSKKYPDIFTNQTLLIQIIFVVIIIGGVMLFENLSDGELFFVNNKSSGEATLMIDFDNMRRAFKGEVAEKMTILDALNASVTAGQIKLTYAVDSDNNTSVVEVDGHSTVPNKNFSFYLNDDKVNIEDINKTHINPGDQITIRLE